MTLKISINKLMREDLRRRTWMLALSCLGSFITSPVIFLFVLTTTSPYVKARLDAAMASGGQELAARLMEEKLLSYFETGHLCLQMIVLFIGAFLAAICGFQYLYSRRMIDLYHGAPATRGKLFLAIWLNGFLIWFVPFLLGHLSVYILALYYIGMPAFWGGVTALMLRELGLFVLCFLAVYHACLVPVMISGNAKNAFVNILIYGLGVLLAYTTAIGYMTRYLDTFYLADTWFCSLPVIGLSPLAAPVFLCVFFVERIPGYLPDTGTITDSYWALLLLWVTAVMLANLALAALLHKKRPSELAERGVENKWFRIPLNTVASVLAGLLLSLFFSLITEETMLGWSCFGAVFGCVLTFACMNILHHTSFKALLRHKLQLFLTLAFTCVVLFAFHFDALGYDAYLPGRDTVTGLRLYSLSFAGEGFSIQEDEAGYYIRHNDYGLDMPGNIIFTDRNRNYRLLETLVEANNSRTETSGETSGYSRHISIHVRVDTTHGSYYRTYRVYTQGACMEALEPFIGSAAFLEHYHPAASGVMKPPAQIQGRAADGIRANITDPGRVEQLYQAYVQDFAEHYDPLDTYFDSNRTFTLAYDYPKAPARDATGAYHQSYYQLSMNVPAWYERTVSLLQEWYPEYIWSLEDLKIASLPVRITRHAAGSTLPSLQEYLGIRDAAEPSAPLQEEAAGTPDKNPGYWYGLIEEPARLQALRPYLYMGSYDGDQFIYIGQINAVRDIEPNMFSVNCYIRRGQVPEGFAESLRFGLP